MLEPVREAGKASFAVGIGAEFEIELADVHEAVRNVDVDFGGVDRSAGRVSDGEIGGARSDATINRWNGLGIGRGSSGLTVDWGGQSEGEDS